MLLLRNKIILAHLGKNKAAGNYKVILLKVESIHHVYYSPDFGFFFTEHHNVVFPRKIRYSNTRRIPVDNPQFPTWTAYRKFGLVYLAVILQCICHCHAVTRRMCKLEICTTTSKQ